MEGDRLVGRGNPFQRTTQVGCATRAGAVDEEFPRLMVRENGWFPAGMETGDVERLKVCANALHAVRNKQQRSSFIQRLEFNTSSSV